MSAPTATVAGGAKVALGATLVMVSFTGFGGLVAVCVPLFLYLTCVGFVFPSAVALALGHHGRVAGMASALLGTMQFGLAGLSTLSLGTLPIATAMPMAAFILVAGGLGVAANVFVIGRKLEMNLEPAR